MIFVYNVSSRLNIKYMIDWVQIYEVDHYLQFWLKLIINFLFLFKILKSTILNDQHSDVAIQQQWCGSNKYLNTTYVYIISYKVRIHSLIFDFVLIFEDYFNFLYLYHPKLIKFLKILCLIQQKCSQLIDWEVSKLGFVWVFFYYFMISKNYSNSLRRWRDSKALWFVKQHFDITLWVY